MMRRDWFIDYLMNLFVTLSKVVCLKKARHKRTSLYALMKCSLWKNAKNNNSVTHDFIRNFSHYFEACFYVHKKLFYCSPYLWTTSGFHATKMLCLQLLMRIQWNLVITKGLRQHCLLRYYEIIRYNEIFLLRLALQHHHSLLRYIEIIRYFEIRNYKISLYK